MKDSAKTVVPAPKQRDAKSLNKVSPKAVKKTDPKAVKKTDPKAVKKTDPKAVKKTDPKAVKKTDPKAVKKTDPKAVKKTDPKAVKKGGKKPVLRSAAALAGKARVESAAKLAQDALNYHEFPKPGKISIQVSKPFLRSEHFSLAYTPGVAEPCRRIALNPQDAYKYTNKGNLVGIISNGTAVLGIGNIGALASKPVMEGKAMLFKMFADIDVFDIEVAASRPEKFIETVFAIAPSFGAINLEDIAAPDCFVIEERLREELSIPVMHDDQTGTGVVVCAALHNALEIQHKRPADIKLVCVGAGAAGIGVLRTIHMFFGLAGEQVHLVDREGLVTYDRNNLPSYKLPFASKGDRGDSLKDVIRGADVLVCVAQKDLISGAMVGTMAARPIIMALANPDPEILPEEVHSVRDDAIIATGRSDYPNQVNNSIGFPYLFRGALDAHAKKFTPAMLAVAIRSIASLARESAPPELKKLYPHEIMSFSRDYIMPKQNDPRLFKQVSKDVRGAYVEADIR